MENKDLSVTSSLESSVMCPICYDSLADGEETTYYTTECSHTFHFTCIKPWLMEHTTCPYCRHELEIQRFVAQEEQNKIACATKGNKLYDAVKRKFNLFSPGTPNGVDPTAVNNWALRWASRNGHLDVVRYLCERFPPGLEYGVDPTALDNFALCWASGNGHLSAVKYLCETFPPGSPGGVDPCANDNQALRWASEYGHLSVVMYLCEMFPPGTKHGVDPTVDNNCALRHASEYGHLSVARYLCENNKMYNVAS